MLGFSKTTPVEIPKLEDHAPYREVTERHARLSAELAQVTADRSQLASQLAAEYGADAGASPLNDSDVEALVLAGGDTARAVRHRELAERFRTLSSRQIVVKKAVALLDTEVVKARKAAQQALAPKVFREVYAPAVRAATEKLLVASKELRDIVNLQHRIDTADLLVGPMSSMNLPVRLLEDHLSPESLVSGLVDAGAVTESEAAELRKRFA